MDRPVEPYHVCIYRLSRNDQAERDPCAKRTFHLYRHSSRNPCLSRFPLDDSDCMILAFLNELCTPPLDMSSGLQDVPCWLGVVVSWVRYAGNLQLGIGVSVLSHLITCLPHQRAPPFPGTLSLPLQTPRQMKRPGAQPKFAGVQEQAIVCCMMP
jgi:hypothetical protein